MDIFHYQVNILFVVEGLDKTNNVREYYLL